MAKKKPGRGSRAAKTPTNNRWLMFLRETSGLKLTKVQKSKLYRNWLVEKNYATEQTHRAPTALTTRANQQLEQYSSHELHHDMTPDEICLFVARIAPLKRLGFALLGIVGSGSYGLVLDLVSATGVPYVMKVSRISTEKLPPVRFPVLNNQRTAWHTITLKDFKRGVRAQQRMALRFKSVRIPGILHAGCVHMNPQEKMGIIIMQKINGKTLRKVLACDKISQDIKLLLVRKAAKISAQFHRAGCIHGDFHTWNIICDGSGHLHIIDFDRSSISSDSAHRLHDIGMMLDTMDMQFWQCYIDAYFGVPDSPIPFVLHGTTDEERKQNLHEQSRDLFRNYLEFLHSK
jgi:hypothetical protein